MEKIYEVKGIVNKGFVGQISYTVNLPKRYDKLVIDFEFDKRTCEDRYAMKDEVAKTLKDKYDFEYASEEELIDAMHDLKTEMHPAIFLNDEFVGNVHKQLQHRTMTITADSASEGCIPCTDIEGVLKVTVVVFNVIYDNTTYTVEVHAC